MRSSRRTRERSWQNVVVDSVEIGESCVAAGCSSDFYIGHSGVSADASGNLVMVYDGATTPGGKQLIFSKRSTNGGLDVVGAHDALAGERAVHRSRRRVPRRR